MREAGGPQHAGQKRDQPLDRRESAGPARAKRIKSIPIRAVPSPSPPGKMRAYLPGKRNLLDQRARWLLEQEGVERDERHAPRAAALRSGTGGRECGGFQ